MASVRAWAASRTALAPNRSVKKNPSTKAARAGTGQPREQEHGPAGDGRPQQALVQVGPPGRGGGRNRLGPGPQAAEDEHEPQAHAGALEQAGGLTTTTPGGG